MPLKTQSTTIEDRTETDMAVEILIADSPDIDAAKEYVIVRVRVDHGNIPLLASIEEEVLHRLRDLAEKERQRLEGLVNQAASRG